MSRLRIVVRACSTYRFCAKKNCCFKLLIFIGDIEGSYLSLSIPFHSRTVVSQNPPKKANEEEVVVMANSSSANSEARAC